MLMERQRRQLKEELAEVRDSLTEQFTREKAKLRQTLEQVRSPIGSNEQWGRKGWGALRAPQASHRSGGVPRQAIWVCLLLASGLLSQRGATGRRWQATLHLPGQAHWQPSEPSDPTGFSPELQLATTQTAGAEETARL